MRLTEHRRAWVLKKVREYSKQIGLEKHPTVVFSAVEWAEYPQKHPEVEAHSHRTAGTIRKRLGYACRKCWAIYLNMRRFKVLSAKKYRRIWLKDAHWGRMQFTADEPVQAKRGDRVLDTLVHELVHIRFPYRRHSPEYRQTVAAIIRGKTFKPYRGRA